VHTFESLKDKPSTMQGYGITDAYTKVKANELLEQRVAADTIISAGFVSGDISKPYFLERKPDGGVGGIINLALAAHVHTFESLKDKPSTMQGYGITDAYTKVKSDELLNQRVAADGIVAAGFVSGDLNYPYFLKSPNSIVHLARRTQVDAKPDGDWVDAVGLVSNEPSLPYMHQKGGGNVLWWLARSCLAIPVRKGYLVGGGAPIRVFCVSGYLFIWGMFQQLGLALWPSQWLLLLKQIR